MEKLKRELSEIEEITDEMKRNLFWIHLNILLVKDFLLSEATKTEKESYFEIVKEHIKDYIHEIEKNLLNLKSKI